MQTMSRTKANKPKARTVVLTVPKEWLDPMDAKIAATGMSRSAFFIQLLKKELYGN